MKTNVTYAGKEFAPYILKEEINDIVQRLAEQMNADYKSKKEDICVVSILDGSFIFMSDLVRCLDFNFTIEFVKIKSYEDTESNGNAEHILELTKSVKGKHIIVVEDIIDTGLTIEVFLEKIRYQEPASLKICTLLSKPEVHNDIIPIDYLGKEIPPTFVIGYGLDINGHGRQLEDIYQMIV